MRGVREPAMRESERLLPGQENSKHKGPAAGAAWCVGGGQYDGSSMSEAEREGDEARG